MRLLRRRNTKIYAALAEKNLIIVLKFTNKKISRLKLLARKQAVSETSFRHPGTKDALKTFLSCWVITGNRIVEDYIFIGWNPWGAVDHCIGARVCLNILPKTTQRKTRRFS